MNVISKLVGENRRLSLALAFFSIMPLLFSSLLGGWLIINMERVSDLMAVHGIWLALASGLTMAAGLTPTTFVALVCGFFLGADGVIPVVLAYCLASGLGYALGRWLDGGRFLDSLKQYDLVSRVADDLGKKPVFMVILVRLSPVLPFCLMNLLLAALRVRLSVFLLAGTLGMLPRTLFSLWAGHQSRDLVTLIQGGGGETEALLVMIGSLATVGLLLWMMTRRVKDILLASGE